MPVIPLHHGQLREVWQGEVASDDVHVNLNPSWGSPRSQREARLAGATLDIAEMRPNSSGSSSADAAENLDALSDAEEVVLVLLGQPAFDVDGVLCLGRGFVDMYHNE